MIGRGYVMNVGRGYVMTVGRGYVKNVGRGNLIQNSQSVSQSVSDEGRYRVVRFPNQPYGMGREKEPPRSWEFYFGAT